MMEAIGYRYSVNRSGDIFIIKLRAYDVQDCYCDSKSDNCVCLSITNANTGEEVEQATLRGIRKNYVEYRKNEKIPGMCWFKKTADDLSVWLHKDNSTGEIYESCFLYRKLDEMMKIYKQQPEAVAAELRISTEELWRRIVILKAGCKDKEEQWGYQILRAMQKLAES